MPFETILPTRGHLPPVSVVLVNWNSIDDTLDCLRSLGGVDYNPMHIIVVDNGSSEGQAEAIQQHFSGVEVHAAGSNLGYTGGNNLGIRVALQAGAEYVLCLNNDTTIAPDCLLRMAEALEENPRAGIATAAIYEANRPEVLAGLGCKLYFDRMLCGEPIRQLPCHASSQAVEAPYVEGCALMLRRAAAEQTGGFDDRFFAYFEDADLCLRARAQGWTSIAVPAARVWHKVENKPTGAASPTACFYSARNSWRLVRRHASFRERSLYYRRYPRQIYWVIRDMLPQPSSGTSSDAGRRRAQGEALLLGAIAGWFGFQGDRRANPWAMAERVLRMTLLPCLRLCFRLYRRHSDGD